MQDPSCLFCRIARKEASASIVYEDDRSLAFNDIRPGAPLHVLVIPKAHIPSLAQADEGSAGHLVSVCNRVAAQSGQAADGYRVVSNIGAAAGQSVDHLHLHVLAGRPFSWPPG